MASTNKSRATAHCSRGRRIRRRYGSPTFFHESQNFTAGSCGKFPFSSVPCNYAIVRSACFEALPTQPLHMQCLGSQASEHSKVSPLAQFSKGHVTPVQES